MKKQNIEMVVGTKKQEEAKMKKQNIENRIENVLEITKNEMKEIRELTRSLDQSLNQKFNNYIEKQEKFLEVEERKRHMLNAKIGLLEAALERIEKEMVENGMDPLDLETDVWMKILETENILKNVYSKRTNNYRKIRSVKNIIKKERKKEKVERVEKDVELEIEFLEKQYRRIENVEEDGLEKLKLQKDQISIALEDVYYLGFMENVKEEDLGKNIRRTLKNLRHLEEELDRKITFYSAD